MKNDFELDTQPKKKQDFLKRIDVYKRQMQKWKGK